MRLPLRHAPRGLIFISSALLTLAPLSQAIAAPPEGDGAPPAEDGEGTPPVDGDDAPAEDGGDAPPVEGGEETPPAEGGEEAPPAEGGDAPAEGGDAPAEEAPAEDPDDDWGDWGDDTGDGPLIVDESENPENQDEQIEQVEVEGEKGFVTGKVVNARDGLPVEGLIVYAKDTEYELSTDANGEFTMELPPGNYTLELANADYKPQEFDVEVLEDKTSDLKKIEMTPTVVEEIAIVEDAPKEQLVEQGQKESTKTEDRMSRKEMSKSGGGSTANVARRIVGSTVVGGRYLFVRGLGHRYGNTLFDGARMPSPEPELRTVPLDIFPTSALASINVVKTFSPDMPADFVGASTQLISRDIPDEFVFEVGASMGVNTVTQFQDFLPDENFGVADAFAFGNIPRGFPEGVPDQQLSGNLAEGGLDPAEVEAYGEAFYFNTRVPLQTQNIPNLSAKFSIGDGYDLGNDHRVGWLISGGYKNSYQNREEINRVLGISNNPQTGEDELVAPVRYTGNPHLTSERQVAWSALGLLKWDAGKNNDVFFTSFYSRDAVNEVRHWRGIVQTVSTGGELSTTRHRYIMRSIWFNQLGAKHRFQNKRGRDVLEMDYFGSYAQARRDDPSIREMVYSRPLGSTGPFRADWANGAGKDLFLDLVDHTESGAVNFKVPFRQWKKLDSFVKFGGWGEGKQRTFDVRRVTFKLINNGNDLVPIGIGDIVNADTVGTGLQIPEGETQPLFLDETTRATDNYEASQQIFAGYAMIELPFVRWFKVIGGARYEYSKIDVNPFDRFNPGSDIETNLASQVVDNDVFPSASLVFSPTEKQNIRLVGTQTIARPEFRELAPFQFTDFVGGFDVEGNPYLKSTHIWNADLRWEWFPQRGEKVSLSAFFKYFDAPIERVVAARIPPLGSFANADVAYNAGGELDLAKSLGFLAKRRGKKARAELQAEAAAEGADAGVDPNPDAETIKGLRWLEDVSIGANVSVIYSRVTVPEPEQNCDPDDAECVFLARFSVNTSRTRPLQGQSPWVVNAYMSYDNDEVGTSARVLYNVYGRRIDQVSGLGLPDIYEEPVHGVDLIFSQRLFRYLKKVDEFGFETYGNELNLDFGVENLLNYKVRFTQGGTETRNFRRGLSFNVGLTYKY